jgi:TIR domain
MAVSPPAATGRIFISYRREETAYPAGWLYDRLVDRFGDAQVFNDVESIAPGDDFVEVITRAVGSCDVLLALIGDQWLTITDADGRRRLEDPGDFVRLEIEAALARQVRVIPILVDGARMPRADELPPSLAALVRRQALELSPSHFAFDIGRLLKVLDITLGEVRTAQSRAVPVGTQERSRPREETKPLATPPRARPAPAHSRPPNKQRRRPPTRAWLLTGVGVGVVLILLLIAAVATDSWSPSPSAARPTERTAAKAAVVPLDDLVADFGRFGFTPAEHRESEAFDLGSLPGYYDATHRRYLRELGLRRALASWFTSSADDSLLEVRIFEFRSPTQARRAQHLLSICLLLPTVPIDIQHVAGSKGTQCVVREGPVQEATFTRGARLYKLKLQSRSQPRPARTIANLARAEAAVAR